ncbi:TetR/AcrR family transcriptional regulator [Actinomadura sp. 7K507]|uniref:TetR/AcrR family transcriptional regulator n=1 Tax=Actinomadura sp. 7K507 TaxID=2530365 RepID=UPI001051E02F|nr:TetR/AcrR family transcriptional regulator [Actinomadura sp. 7K507]TDC82158.1 TetR/AcrR family transcriptional regulator [Actinomadura sp. 7K507]
MGSKAVLPPERRSELLDLAMEEFVRHGFGGASLNRIIRSCGMSKSSFYHYFESKEALFDAVVNALVDELNDAVKVPEPDSLAVPGFWDEVARMSDDLMGAAAVDCRLIDFWRLFYVPDAPAHDGGSLARVKRGIDDWLGRALAAGRSAGAVRDDLPPSLQGELTLATLWTINAWALRHLGETDIAEGQRLAHVQIDLLRGLLAAP